METNSTVSLLFTKFSRDSPDAAAGKIIVVPLVNVHAFSLGQALSPVDNRKMNRCFPGRREGTSSERIAYHLFRRAIRQADYCLDLHQGGVHPMIDEVRVRVDEKHTLHSACLELARVFGIGYILNQKGPRGQLAQAARRSAFHDRSRIRWHSRLGCGEYRKRRTRCAERFAILPLH